MLKIFTQLCNYHVNAGQNAMKIQQKKRTYYKPSQSVYLTYYILHMLYLRAVTMPSCESLFL